MCLFCWKVTGATFVGVVLVGRLKRCGLNGLPVAVALPAPAALPTSAGLPAGVGLPPGCGETCPACAPFFCSFFFPFSSCCCAPATHASARLQIKTRNILIGFFLLACLDL